MNFDDQLKRIDDVFLKNFGRTPLNERLQDILREALELSRYTDIKSLKEESGDLLCSLLQFFNETEFDLNETIDSTLKKIELRNLQYKSLGRKIQVAILGGAFNPIHNGHIEIAKALLNWSKIFDEVWLMPCYSHMYGKNLESTEHRLNMCKLAVKDARIKVCDYEITKKLSGETYYLVKRLLEDKNFKNIYNFSLVIGQDNANTFDSWVNYDDLERMIRFVVIPRQNVDFKSSSRWYLKSPHIYLQPDKPICNISSTEIRKYIYFDRRVIEKLVDKDVLDYILKNHLYKTED